MTRTQTWQSQWQTTRGGRVLAGALAIGGLVSLWAAPASASGAKGSKHPTTTTLSCSPSSVQVGTSSTCSASVADTSSTPTTATGTVSFKSTGPGSFSPGSCTLSGGTCSVTFTPSAKGPDTVTASYGGDSGHATSSGSAPVTATLRSSSTTLACAPSSVVVGSASTCTATVADTASGSPSTPGGTVSFAASGSAGTFNVPSCSLANGSCSVTFTPSGAGTTTITASYPGDSVHAASSGTATVWSQTSKDPTSTQPVCVNTCSTTPGQQVGILVFVADNAQNSTHQPSGSVSFTASSPGVFSATSCTLSPNTSNTATCGVDFTPSAPATGIVTAAYGGDNTAAPSSGTIAITALDLSSTSVVCSPAAMPMGASASCTATVTDTRTGSLTPTGTLSWSNQGTSYGAFSPTTCSLSTSGSCTVTWTPTVPGTASISSSYPGDSTHSASTGSSGSILVGGTTTTIACSGSTLDGSSPSGCTATVTSPDPGTISGTVSFSDGSSLGLWASTYAQPATCQLSNGSCSVSYVSTRSGAATMEADYSGDATFAGSTGTTSQQLSTGVLSSSHTALSCSPAAITTSQLTTCTATVTDAANGAPIDGDTVSFASSGAGAFEANSCTVVLGSCSVDFQPAATGNDLITAVDSGDRTYTASSAMTIVTVASTVPTGTAPSLLTATGPGTLVYSGGGVSIPWWCDNGYWGFLYPVFNPLSFGYCGRYVAVPGASATLDGATLTDTNGAPLAGRTLTFSAGTWSATAITNAQGFAAVTTTRGPVASGTIPHSSGYTVSFAGDTTYKPNTSTWP